MVDELSSIAYIDPEFNNDKEKEIKEAEEFLDKHKKYIQNIKLNKYSIGIKKKILLLLASGYKKYSKHFIEKEYGISRKTQRDWEVIKDKVFEITDNNRFLIY